MPRRFLKRYLPDHHKLREHKHLRFLGDLLHDPNLWHLNKRSVSGAFSVGLFTAFIPIPAQMLFAAIGSILFRVNLPISVALVWLTNPVTMAPVLYFAYKLGGIILGVAPEHVDFELSLEWFETEFGQVWQPFVLGLCLLATGSAALSNIVVRLIWRLAVVRSWSRRKRRRIKNPTLP